MENLPKNLNRDYNEALRTRTEIEEKVEQFYDKPETDEDLEKRVGIIRGIPDNINTPKVLLKLGDPSRPDKFVHMRDEDGRDYVIALPIEKRAYHRDIASFCRKLYNKELTVIGGGYTHAEGNKLIVHGKSVDFGEADKEKVGQILQEAFPDLKIQIITVAEKAEEERERLRKEEESGIKKDYVEALEKIDGKLEKEVYEDVVLNKAVRMGYDLTMLPRSIDGAKDNMAYMVFRSENGSSFGVDALYVGYKDAEGNTKSKEVAQTRWNLSVTKAEVKDGILTIDFKTEDDKNYTVSTPIDDVENIDTISNLNETEKIILEMYKNNQEVYKRSHVVKIWHNFVH